MIDKAIATILLAAGIAAPASVKADGAAAMTLYYERPAAAWTEALPIGNGRLGALAFRRPTEELAPLTEATLWSGGPVGSAVNPGAHAAIGEVRQALAGGDYKAA